MKLEQEQVRAGGLQLKLEPRASSKKWMTAMLPVDNLKNQVLGGHTATERGKAVKLAKGGAFQLQTSLFQRFRNTPVFIG